MDRTREPMRLVVAGAAGRMGRSLIEAVVRTEGTVLAGAFEHALSSAVGQDACASVGLEPGGVSIVGDVDAAISQADGILDFTTPQASADIAEIAASAGIAHIIGTTGLGSDHLAVIGEAAQKAAIVQSGNMSLGVNLLSELVRQAAAALTDDYDIEILEMHHRQKVDAPSGTALMLGAAAAEGRQVDLESHGVYAREGQVGARPPGTIGFATLRGGGVIGDHSAIFAGLRERIVLSHYSGDRALFSDGAVRAALWAQGRAPGLYSMRDVLGMGGPAPA